MIEEVTVTRCIEFAIETEKIGAGLYRRLRDKFVGNPELQELFAGLAGDELDHERQFRALLDRTAAKSRDTDISFERQNYLRAMSISEVFSGSKALGKDIDSIKTREDALERALQFEKATLAYYQAMSEVIGEDAAIGALIAVEKSHVVKVMELLLTGAKFRGLDDDG